MIHAAKDSDGIVCIAFRDPHWFDKAKRILSDKDIVLQLEWCEKYYKEMLERAKWQSSVLNQHGVERVLEALNVCTYAPQRANDIDKTIYAAFEVEK